MFSHFLRAGSYKLLVVYLVFFSVVLQAGLGPMTDEEVQFLREFQFNGTNVYVKPPELEAWVSSQNQKTRSLLNEAPLAAQIKTRAAQLVTSNPASRYAVPGGEYVIKSGSLFFIENEFENLIVDKNQLSGSIITDMRPSPDGLKVAYAVTKEGSDSSYWFIYDRNGKKTLLDMPTRVRIYDLNWALDSNGFYYSKWPDLENEFLLVKNKIQRQAGISVAYHQLGSSALEEKIVFENPLISTNFAISEIPQSKMLVAYRTKLGLTHRLAIFLGHPNESGRYIWDNLENSQKYFGRVVGVDENWIYVLSSELGNSYGIIGYSTTKPTVKRTIVPANSKLVLNQAQKINNNLIAQYVDFEMNVQLKIFDMTGTEKDLIDFVKLGLSSNGTIPAILNGGLQSSKFYFTYSGIEFPTVTITYDLLQFKLDILPSSTPVDFDSSGVSNHFYKYPSNDGTSIPLLVYQRTDQPKPDFIYLYYYGSNGVINLPGFNRKFQLIIELGGAVALAGVRGGGEGGAAWYEQGMMNREKSVEDVISATYFLRELFSDPKLKIAASGRSYGGMLTNAVITKAEGLIELFTPIASVADLSYYLTDFHGCIGWDDLGFERDLEGQIIDNAEARKKLTNWSPIENISAMKIVGSVLVFTADQDERVGPHQSYLMTAALQKQFPENPIYMLEQPKSGHAARTEIDEVTFISLQFGIEKIRPLKKNN